MNRKSIDVIRAWAMSDYAQSDLGELASAIDYWVQTEEIPRAVAAEREAQQKENKNEQM